MQFALHALSELKHFAETVEMAQSVRRIVWVLKKRISLVSRFEVDDVVFVDRGGRKGVLLEGYNLILAECCDLYKDSYGYFKCSGCEVWRRM